MKEASAQMNATGFAGMKVWRLMVFDVPPEMPA
jgi:hypothetical protein